MSPQEKAQKLYLKMLDWQSQSNIYIERNIICPLAKQSALIAVDEIIEVAECLDYEFGDDLFFWQEVKQEIEKL